MNFGNNVNIAENIWMTIHNPVTEEIITTGKNIPSITDEEDKYYVKGHDLNDNNSFKCFKKCNIVGGRIIKQ